MQEAIGLFLVYGRFERHFSKNTLDAYRNDLNHLALWLDEKRLSFESAGHSDLTDFLVEKKMQGYRFSSIARNLFCLRVFFAWLNAEGGRPDNPAELLESPRLWSTLPELLSPKEIDRLIDSVRGKPRRRLRTHAILEVLYGCGLRISELVNLRIENINLPRRYLLCLGKGSRERMVPFTKAVSGSLRRWLDKGRPAYLGETSSPFLFVGQKKTPLSRQHVWLELKNLAKAADLGKNIYPHIFRHSYATHLLAGGGDLRVVQELLGHADIMTTQRYTQVDGSVIRGKYRKFHPRAEIKGVFPRRARKS